MNYYKIEKREGYIIISLIAISAISQGLYFPIQYYLGNLTITLIAVYLFIKNRGTRYDKKPLFFLCVFTIIYIVSALASENKIIAIEETVRILGFIPAFITGVYMNKTLFKFWLKGIFVSSILVSIIGLLAMANLLSMEGAIYNGRLQSTILYANTTGLFILCGILSCFLVFNKKDSLFFISIYLLILALISTYSRSIWIIFILIMALLLFNKEVMSKEEKYKLANVFIFDIITAALIENLNGIYYLFLPVLGIAIILLIFKVLSEEKTFYILCLTGIIFVFNNKGLIRRILNIDINASEFNARKVYYIGAFKVIVKNPILGCGVRGWEIISRSVVGLYTKYVHNYYLQIACDGGLIALTAFTGFIYTSIRQYTKSLSNYISLLIIIVILLHSFLDVSMHFQLISYILFITSGRIVRNVPADNG